MNFKKWLSTALILFVGGVLALIVTLVLVLDAPTPLRHGIELAALSLEEADVQSTLNVVEKQRRPNVVFILADDLGYGDLQVYADTPIKTPSLTRLADEGMRFDNFYAPAPLCSPSRAGFPPGPGGFQEWLGERGSAVLAALGTLDMRDGGNLVNGLPLFELTIAEGLKQAGYRTGIVGKWHLGDFKRWPEFHPSQHGFDYFAGFNASNDDWPAAYFEGHEEIVEDIGIDQSHYTQVFTEKSIEFVERHAQSPFFLMVSHKDPHQPFFPSADFAGQSDAGPYGDAVEELDASVGEILAALERLGVADHTLVVFASDNGPWYEGSAGALRGRKGVSHDGGYKVPFIVRYPAVIGANEVESVPVTGLDLLPTIFGFAGVDLPQDRTIDGVRLFNEAGQIEVDPMRPIFMSAGFEFEAVRSGDLKFLSQASTYLWPFPIDKPVGIGAALAPRYTPADGDFTIDKLKHWPSLYDLSVDTSESYDISPNEPEKTEAMSRLLKDWNRDFLRDVSGTEGRE
ncbi:MAG: sulfatase-like hydrolase/transferase [Pseudomonadales bacterium]|nr:sulfatase-like hydrolase/transferase [Pseudomonadales bacterium]